jgi:hypothetical protein
MTEINAFGWTYVGTAEGDHGVFTHGSGEVFAGQIAGGAACVGVATKTNGNTYFVEFDADGEPHGRYLACWTATGDTVYHRYEHGNYKESARLNADGTCMYNGKACRADFTPFAALRAKVVPIKARPPLVPTQPPFFMPHCFAPTASHSIGPIGHWFGTRRSSRRPTPTRCALADSAINACMARALRSTAPAKRNAPRIQPGRRTGRRGALRMRHKPHA